MLNLTKTKKIYSDVDEKPELQTLCRTLQPWVEKYKPKTIKDIIGQQGANSNCAK